MTVGEIQEMLRDINPDLILFFSADGQEMHSPCPAESGMIVFGPASPYINEEGNLVDPEDGSVNMPTHAFLLLPHNENNPHE